MITYIFNTAACVLFNLVNSRIDAYKIKFLHKEVRHGINMGAYLTLVGFLIWRQVAPIWGTPGWSWVDVWQQIIFLISALANRQLSFDIPLNLRRGLKWHYQSTAEKPKAIWDRVERWIFGKLSGKVIAGVYAGLWLACTVVRVFL